MNYKEIKGDLIGLALQGKFDLIAQGNNCQCVQKSGIAKRFVEEFQTDKFESEIHNKGIHKLGNIEWEDYYLKENKVKKIPYYSSDTPDLTVINCYTQEYYGTDKIHLDYEALTLCLRKINRIFMGQHIGLPLIGCGLAGGDWSRVKKIIQTELKDMNVTVVHYEKNRT